MSLWRRSRLARRTIWMRSRYLGSVSSRKAWSSLWVSSCGKRIRITTCLPSWRVLLYPPSLYASDSLTERLYQAVLTADFNGDGRLDLAAANSSSSDVSVLLGNADGTFQPAQNYAAGGHPLSLAAGAFHALGTL